MNDPYKHRERLNRVLSEIETGQPPQPSKRGYPRTFPVRTIPKSNKQAILKFATHTQAEGCTPARTLRLVEYCRDLNSLLGGKDFKEASKDDLVSVVGKLESAPIKPWTKCGFKAAIKKFYRWYEGDGEEYPKKIKWIKTTMKQHERKLPEAMISREELKRIIEFCESPRDRALVAILGECGPRCSELLALRVKHYNPADDALGGNASVLFPEGKSGARKNPIMFSASFITEWLNCHPKRDDPNAELWYTDRKDKDAIGPGRVRAILARAAKKAGVKKPCNPHAFRHAAATFYAQFMNEFQLKIMFGWTGNAAATYTHLSSKNLVGACQQANAMPVKEEPKAANGELLPIQCPKCRECNPPQNQFCWRCGSVMDMRVALEQNRKTEEMDSVLQKLLTNPQTRQVFKELLKQVVHEDETEGGQSSPLAAGGKPKETIKEGA